MTRPNSNVNRRKKETKPFWVHFQNPWNNHGQARNCLRGGIILSSRFRGSSFSAAVVTRLSGLHIPCYPIPCDGGTASCSPEGNPDSLVRPAFRRLSIVLPFWISAWRHSLDFFPKKVFWGMLAPVPLATTSGQTCCLPTVFEPLRQFSCRIRVVFESHSCRFKGISLVVGLRQRLPARVYRH